MPLMMIDVDLEPCGTIFGRGRSVILVHDGWMDEYGQKIHGIYINAVVLE